MLLCVMCCLKRHMLPQLPHSCARDTTRVATDTIHVAMSVDYGELRHFYDDPVCPDPVWKLLWPFPCLILVYLRFQGIDFEQKESTSCLRPIGTTNEVKTPPDSRLKLPESWVGQRPCQFREAGADSLSLLRAPRRPSA